MVAKAMNCVRDPVCTAKVVTGVKAFLKATLGESRINGKSCPLPVLTGNRLVFLHATVDKTTMSLG